MLAKKLLAATAAAGPIAYVGGYALGNNAPASPWTVSLTALTGGLASQPSAGDIVIVFFGATKDLDLTMGFSTSGYTELYETYTSAPAGTNILVGYKVMGPTPDTSVTVTCSDTTRGWSIAAVAFRNVNPTPFDVVLTSAKSTASDVDPPAITPVTAGAVVVSGGVAADDTALTFTSSDLTGFITAIGTLSDSNIVGVGRINWTGGSVNPAAFGGNTGVKSWAAVSLALRPI